MTLPPDPQPYVVIGLKEVYDAVLRLQAIVERQTGQQDEHGRDLVDHETRLRSLERGRWPLPTITALAAAGGRARRGRRADRRDPRRSRVEAGRAVRAAGIRRGLPAPHHPGPAADPDRAWWYHPGRAAEGEGVDQDDPRREGRHRRAGPAPEAVPSRRAFLHRCSWEAVVPPDVQRHGLGTGQEGGRAGRDHLP